MSDPHGSSGADSAGNRPSSDGSETPKPVRHRRKRAEERRERPAKKSKSPRRLARDTLVLWQRGRVHRLAAHVDTETRGWTRRDRGFARDLVLGCARHERFLRSVLEVFFHSGMPKDAVFSATVMCGAHQLLFQPGIGAHAAVHETVELLRARRGLANAVLRRLSAAVVLEGAEPAADAVSQAGPAVPLPADESGLTRTLRLPETAKDFPDPTTPTGLATRWSLPDEVVERWIERFGSDRAAAIAEASGRTPGLVLRAMPGAEGADELCQRLALEGIRAVPCARAAGLSWPQASAAPANSPDGASPLVWVPPGQPSPFASDLYADGVFVAQDPAAFAAVAAIDAQPGDIVLDLCAAPGTKTTWLAASVQPGGRVVAWDPDPHRRGSIVENVVRLGLETSCDVADAAPMVGEQSFDRVLADVPCSNSGVLARRVETRMQLTIEGVEERAGLQRELLNSACELVRPGGVVVYSTCSLEAEENEDVVQAVLGSRSDMELKHANLVLPRPAQRPPSGSEGEEASKNLGHPGHDGGYHAVLARADA